MSFTVLGADSLTSLWPAEEPDADPAEWGFVPRDVQLDTEQESASATPWFPDPPTWQTLEGVEDLDALVRDGVDWGPYDVPRPEPDFCEGGWCETLQHSLPPSPTLSAREVMERNCIGLGGSYLEPPAFLSVHLLTRDCFAGWYGDTSDWPQDDCPSPCILPRSVDDCYLPTEPGPMDVVAFDGVLQTNAIVTLLPPFAFSLTSSDPEASNASQDLLAAAAQLLSENADLVEWVLCLTGTWAPTLNSNDTAAMVQYILEAIDGAFNLYAVGTIQRVDDQGNPTGSPLGVATGTDFQPDDGGQGAIIPVNHPTWLAAAAAYQAGPSPTALCALVFLAGTILHELIHKTATNLGLEGFEQFDDDYPNPGAANDQLVCWAIQNMAARSFMWAMAQRFPCIKDIPCCPLGWDVGFMDSEEDVFGVPPSPFPWNPNTPC